MSGIFCGGQEWRPQCNWREREGVARGGLGSDVPHCILRDTETGDRRAMHRRAVQWGVKSSQVVQAEGRCAAGSFADGRSGRGQQW